MDKIAKAYKDARKLLNLSMRKAATLAGVTTGVVQGAESGKVSNPSWIYTKFLIEQGINPYFLIGASDEIKGQKITGLIPESEYGKLEKELETVQTKYETLRDLFKMLRIEIDEDKKGWKKMD